jgi:hypothetical protein
MSQTLESRVLDSLLEPVSRCLTPEGARQLVGLRIDPAVQERLDLLAEKSTEDELSAEERLEYETYIRAIDFIAVLQAKARALLANEPRS